MDLPGLEHYIHPCYKENLQYADGVWPGSPDHHSTATLEVSPPPTNLLGKRLTYYILHTVKSRVLTRVTN